MESFGKQIEIFNDTAEPLEMQMHPINHHNFLFYHS